MKSRSKKSHFWVGQSVSDSLNSAVRFLCVVEALEIHVADRASSGAGLYRDSSSCIVSDDLLGFCICKLHKLLVFVFSLGTEIKHKIHNCLESV